MKIRNFVLFIRYEEFIETIKEKHYEFYDKNKQLIGFLEAHIRSYTYTFYDGKKYYYDDSILIERRRKNYENDFIWGFKELNNRLIEKNIFINYDMNIKDLMNYAKKYLLY